MARRLVPVAPAIEQVAAALQLGNGRAWKARFYVQGVARLEESEAAGQEARHVERLLDVQPMVDHRAVGLHVDLRLAVGAHAAQRGPEPVVPEGERGDQRVQGRLARLDAIGTPGSEGG